MKIFHSVFLHFAAFGYSHPQPTSSHSAEGKGTPFQDVTVWLACCRYSAWSRSLSSFTNPHRRASNRSPAATPNVWYWATPQQKDQWCSDGGGFRYHWTGHWSWWSKAPQLLQADPEGIAEAKSSQWLWHQWTSSLDDSAAPLADTRGDCGVQRKAKFSSHEKGAHARS